MLDRPRDSAATNNETAINELRAQLSEGLARLDQLTVGLQAVQEFLWPMQAPDQPGQRLRLLQTAAALIPEVMAKPEPISGRGRSVSRPEVILILYCSEFAALVNVPPRWLVSPGLLGAVAARPGQTPGSYLRHAARARLTGRGRLRPGVVR